MNETRLNGSGCQSPHAGFSARAATIRLALLVVALCLALGSLAQRGARPLGLIPAYASANAQEVTVRLPQVMIPWVEADFTADTTIGFAPLEVKFTNTSIGIYSASRWDFGDGESSTLRHPGHTFSTAGTFTVTLTVSRTCVSDTLTRISYITVYAPAEIMENGSFEQGWSDMDPAGTLVNQQPTGWTLEWVEPGSPIFGSGDIAGGVPECVHKHNNHLPPHEQLGGPEALILEGEWTYKVFQGDQPFGVTLSQTVTGLAPGSAGRFLVPVQAHLHGDSTEWGAASGVWVEAGGGWVSAHQMGDRDWYHHMIDFKVPADGKVTVLVRFKSTRQWWPKDFFIDAVEMIATRD